LILCKRKNKQFGCCLILRLQHPRASPSICVVFIVLLLCPSNLCYRWWWWWVLQERKLRINYWPIRILCCNAR
jgi:hypothetical protein